MKQIENFLEVRIEPRILQKIIIILNTTKLINELYTITIFIKTYTLTLGKLYMIPSRLKDLKNLSSLPPTRQLKYYKVIFFVSVGLMVLMSFFSLGVTGSNFMIWSDMQTEAMRSVMSDSHHGFFSSQQLIIAFDVLCLAIVLLLTFSVFKFYTKGNLIIMVISLSFWLVRWSASIFFLASDSSLKQENEKKFSMIYTDKGELNPLCRAEECTGSFLNYVECGKLLMWKQLQRFQVGYLVFTILFGIVLLFTAYKTNQLDVEYSTEDQVELTQNTN